MTGFRVGVDIGGTFTDIVFLGADGRIHTKKVPSSVDDYARAIIAGISEVFADTGLAADDVQEIRHGTTIAANAILEHKGARTGLITTKGFRDILEIRTLRMPRLYDLTWEKPPPLVERYLRTVVDERVSTRGEVQKPLRVADAERAVDKLLAEGVEAIAVCLLKLVCQPGPRTDDQGRRQGPRPRPAAVHQFRGVARDSRVRSHLDHGDQHLCDAHRGPLPYVAAPRPRRRRRRRAASLDAIQRRPHHGRDGDAAADAYHRIRTGRRRGRRPGFRQQDRPEQHHHLRHGGDDGQGLAGGERSGSPDPSSTRSAAAS